MPTLLRLIVVAALLAGAAYAGMFALATLVKPVPRPMEQTISPAKLR